MIMMKRIIYLIIFIGVFFACNEKQRAQSSKTGVLFEDIQTINSNLLHKAYQMREEFQWSGNLFFGVTLFQRNDSRFVSIFVSSNPPVRPLEPPVCPPIFSWIGFTNIEEDYFLFYGNVSNEFLETIVQYDILKTCWEDLELLPHNPETSRLSLVYTFFINEQGCFIFERKANNFE